MQTDYKESLGIGKIRALNGCMGRLIRAATRLNQNFFLMLWIKIFVLIYISAKVFVFFCKESQKSWCCG